MFERILSLLVRSRQIRRLLAVVVGLALAGVVSPPQEVRAEEPVTADTSLVFESWEEWQGAYDEVVAALDAFEALMDESIGAPKELLAVMGARDRVYRTARAVEGYIYLRLQLDATDEEARSRQHLLDDTDRRWYGKGSPWLNRSLTDLGSSTIQGWLASDEALTLYGFFFRRFFESAGYPFPEGQKDLRALDTIFERQTDRVYRAVTVAEPPSVEVKLESGESLEMNVARARMVFEELTNVLDRHRVSQEWLEELGGRSQTYAALLEGIVKRHKLLAEVRGFDSALSAQLHADAISDQAVRNVVNTAREGVSPLRQYHALRKMELGIEEYGLADRFVPLVPGGQEITLEEARRLILWSSATFGPEVEDLVARAFSERWVDAVERPGKRVHGGSTFVNGQPFVYVNYRGTLDSVFQLVHELGHAVHAFLAYQAQPFVYSHRSSLTSEAVASVFEGALVDFMVGEAESPEAKVRVLDLSLQNLLRLFYRPMLDADFEIRVHEAAGSITGPLLGELYLEVVTLFYGGTVSLNTWDAYTWQQTPHFYTAPLYLGRYGLASAAASVLASRLTEPDPTNASVARREFVELMKSGASDYPLELLRVAGADLEDPETVQILVARAATLVDELETLLGSK